MLKELFVIICLSALAGCAYNFSNLSLIQERNPSNSAPNSPSTLENITVWSVDNEYYLTPPENFIAGNGWRRSPAVGKGSYTRRTPGYSLVYYSFISLAGKTGGLHLIRAFQFLLYLLSIAAVHKILLLLEAGNFSRRFLTAIYGLTPWFSSYTFYTLTESLSPYLIIFYVLFLFKALKEEEVNKKLLFLMVASFFIGYAILTRPVLGMAGFLLPVAVVLAFKDFVTVKGMLFKMIISGIIPISMLTVWTVRNYMVTGEIIVLEKDLDPETLDPLKPEMKALWGLTKCWGAEHLWPYQDAIFKNALKGDSLSEKDIMALYKTFPESAVRLLGKDSIIKSLKEYKAILITQNSYYNKLQPLPPDYSSEQKRLTKKFNDMTSRYRQAYPFESYILSPLKYLKLVIFHSNTSNLFLFDKQFRDFKPINLLRLGLAAMHISLFFIYALHILLVRQKSVFENLAFLLLPALMIIFFVFYHKEYEQRYMLPLLPLIIIGAHTIIDPVIKSIYKKAKDIKA